MNSNNLSQFFQCKTLACHDIQRFSGSLISIIPCLTINMIITKRYSKVFGFVNKHYPVLDDAHDYYETTPLFKTFKDISILGCWSNFSTTFI